MTPKPHRPPAPGGGQADARPASVARTGFHPRQPAADASADRGGGQFPVPVTTPAEARATVVYLSWLRMVIPPRVEPGGLAVITRPSFRAGRVMTGTGKAPGSPAFWPRSPPSSAAAALNDSHLPPA